LTINSDLMKDLNAIGNFTQNGRLTNRNDKGLILNNKSSFNLINNGFVSPTHILIKHDSALTEK